MLGDDKRDSQICWFHEPRAQRIEEVGGKGANLAIMTEAGMPVPPGFCVTAQAYRRVITEAGLWAPIQDLLAGAPQEDHEGSQQAAARIRELIEGAAVPAELSRAIIDAWRELGSSSGQAMVAVRSSATAEDLPEASFAGQQDTYLGVAGEQLLTSIQACWASLWTHRAIAYRERQGFEHRQVSLSVVVQSMIHAETAGVLFTANPLNGRRDQMLLNGSYGLGESVVSGRVTPDSFVLTGEEVERTLGTKQTRLELVAGGGTRELEVCTADRDKSCLSDVQIRELSALGARVQGHYGTPQDIEWAFAEGSLYLLQARPITSLGPPPPPPQRALSKSEHRVVDDILEHFPDPPFPLDHEAVVDTYQQLVAAGGALGFELPPADRIIVMDARGVPRVEPAAPRVTLGVLRLPFALWSKMRVDPRSWVRERGVAFNEEIEALAGLRVDALSDQALADAITGATKLASRIGGLRFSDYIFPMILRSGLLRVLLRLGGAGPNTTAADLLATLPYKTAQINEALEELSRVAAASPFVASTLGEQGPEQALAALAADPRAQEFMAALQRFLDEFGARTMKVYLPFSNLSWSEDPVALLATLAVMVRAGADAERRAAHTREAYDELVGGVTRGLWLLRGSFTRILDRYRQGHIAREATLFDIERCYAVARRGTREAGSRLVARGVLEEASEVRYLRMAELLALLHGDPNEGVAAEVRERRGARPVAAQAWASSAGPILQAEDGALRGLAGSPGVATGPARVISGPAEFSKLEPNDVLVCPYTDPAWTPLFSMACAVVADTGGPLSHAAIVAREFGIPAVLGTQLATVTFEDGQVITVDGSSGRVSSPGCEC